jgi:hypothetical protein
LFDPAPQRPQGGGLDAECTDAQRGVRVAPGHVQCRVDPFHGVRESTSHPPVATERNAHHEGWFGAGLANCMGERGVEVVDIGVESGEVRLAARAQERLFGSVLLGQREVVAPVPLADGLPVAGGGKALGGVGADRFEHPEPGDGVRVAADEHVLGDEPVERVEIGAGDRLGRLDGRAAGEDRKRAKHCFSASLSMSWPQSMVARSVRWRAGASRAPVPNAPSARSRRSAISPGDSNPQRAAASSIASGSPSTRRQISATAAALASAMRKLGSWARARSQNSATAGTSTSASASSSSSGNASGATG